jgi:ketosteroid isomerase-like protein
MSEKNLDLVRKGWSLWEAGNFAALLEKIWDPEIVWDITHYRDWPESVYEGHDGVRRFLTEWLDLWENYEVGVDELLLAPDGRVVSLAWQRGRGRESGLEMDMKWAQVTTICDGRVTRIDNYDNRDAALEAAGLSE